MIAPDDARGDQISTLKQHAFCQITPNAKVLLSTLDDVHFDKKYDVTSPDLWKQCLKGVGIQIFVENTAGKIIKIQTGQTTQFPACRDELMNVDGGGSWYRIHQSLFVPGAFV